MDCKLPAGAMGLIDTETGIFAPMPIEEVDLPVRARRPHQSWKRIDDGAEVVLHARPFAMVAVIGQYVSLQVTVDGYLGVGKSAGQLPGAAFSSNAAK
jgi:hypothetical protein